MDFLTYLQPRSLKTRLTLLTLVIFIVSIASLLVYASAILREDMQRLVGEQQLSTATLVAAKVGQAVDERFVGLRVSAKKITPALMANPVELQSFLQDRPVIHGQFNRGGFVTGTDGVAIASFPISAGRTGLNYADHDYIIAALKEGRSTVGRPVIGKPLGTPVLVMAVPIRDSQGVVIGALMGVTDLGQENFMDIITSNRYGKTGGFFIIAPQHRLVVTATDKGRVMEVLPAAGVNPTIDRLLDGFEGTVVLSSTTGKEVLNSGRNIPLAGWQLVASLPTEEAFAPIGEMQRRILLPTLYFSVLAALLVWLVVRQQLAPMVSAVDTLSNMNTAGELPPALHIAKNDEVGRLIGAFNRMLTTLKQREELLRRTTRIARIDGWEVDLRTGERVWGPEILRMLEIDSGVAPNTDEAVRSFYPAEMMPVFEKTNEFAVADGTPWDIEVQMITTTGRKIWVREQGAPVFEDGKVVKLIGTQQDITEQKQAEMAKRDVEAALIEAQRVAHVGSWDWDTTNDTIIWSDEMYKILDQDRRTDASPPDYERNLKLYTAESGVRLNAAVARAMQTGAAYELDLEHIDSNGKIRYISARGEVKRDADGKIIGLRGSAQDITERKRIERALAAQHDFADQIIKAVGQGLTVTNEKGCFEYVNPAYARLVGRDAADLIGKTPEFVAYAVDLAVQVRELAARRAGQTSTYDMRLQHLDGSVVNVLITAAPRFLDGKFAGSIAVVTDQTERNQAEATRASLEAQLRESQKMQAIGTLAGGIAHDFNNILAAILGNAELARQDASNNPDIARSIEEIRKAGTRGRDLVQQILSFSRRQPTEMKPVAIALILDESAKLLRATLPARLTLAVDCAPAVPAVMADKTQIEQVLINLVTNAMQAIPGGSGRIDMRADCVMLDPATVGTNASLIALSAEHAGQTVRLMVRDNGPGMDAATVARIFEPFFTTKPVNEGTGLGLSVVHGIVESHGGAITVDSAPGAGTTFSVYLPVAAAVGRGQAPAETVIVVAAGDAARPALTLDNGPRILYLDDDESMVLLVERLLERRGYRTSAYSDQREALAALAAAPASFDLVVTDYNMPGMSGLDVARAIRAIRDDLPVAIASGFIDEQLRAEAEQAGVKELMFKADLAEDFCDAVARLAKT